MLNLPRTECLALKISPYLLKLSFFKQNFQRIKIPNKWVALEGGVDLLNGHSVFEDHSSVSETCEYQIERSLTHMSDWRDYLIEFKWSLPIVKEENTAVKMFKTTKDKFYKQFDFFANWKGRYLCDFFRVFLLSEEICSPQHYYRADYGASWTLSFSS